MGELEKGILRESVYIGYIHQLWLRDLFDLERLEHRARDVLEFVEMLLLDFVLH